MPRHGGGLPVLVSADAVRSDGALIAVAAPYLSFQPSI